MGVSTSRSRQTPVDMTPGAFSNLQGPFASVLGQLLGFQQGGGQQATGGGGGIQANAGPGAGGAGGAYTGVAGGGQTGQAQTGGGIQSNMGPGSLTFGGGVAGLGARNHPAQIAGSSGGRGAGASNRQHIANNPFGRGMGQTGQGNPAFSPFGDAGNVLRGIPTYQGQLTAGITGNEQSILDALMGMTGGSGTGSASQNFLNQSIGGEFIPDQQQIADMTAGEATGFADQLGLGVPDQMTPEQVQQFADRMGLTVPDNMTPEQARDFVSRLGLGYNPGQSLEGFAQELGGAAQTQGYDPNGNNPFVNAAIEAATRPILQQLEEQTTRTLPGRFTQAGHFTQPGGSSAFDRAAAIATRGAAQEIGDISSDISFRSFEAERGRQFEAQEGARAREAEALAQELERRGQFGEAARAREAYAMEQQLARSAAERDQALGRRSEAMESQLGRSSAEREAALERRFGNIENQLARGNETREAERNRQFTGREAALNRQQEAALQQPGLQQQEIETMLANLQAQGLPRMIEDMGIERGIEQFNTQINNLLTTLGITAGVTRPVISQEGSSSSGGFNLK